MSSTLLGLRCEGALCVRQEAAESPQGQLDSRTCQAEALGAVSSCARVPCCWSLVAKCTKCGRRGESGEELLSGDASLKDVGVGRPDCEGR